MAKFSNALPLLSLISFYCLVNGNTREKRMGQNMYEDTSSFGLTTECGKRWKIFDRPEQFQKRIVAGESSRPGQWPWMAAMLLLNGHAKCGGTLLAPSVVLTAAHCLYHKRVRNVYESDIYIGVGHIKVDDFNKKDNLAQVLRVKKIVIHPQYIPVNHTNDLAIIFLLTPATLNKNVQPVCLPKDRNLFFNNNSNECFVAGWGKDCLRERGVKSCYKEQELKHMKPLGACNLHLKYPGKEFYPILYAVNECKMLCVQFSKDTGSYYGDSGGPLMCKTKRMRQAKWTIVGVVSFGKIHRLPAEQVHIRVAHYVTWIRRVVEKERKLNNGVYSPKISQCFDKKSEDNTVKIVFRKK